MAKRAKRALIQVPVIPRQELDVDQYNAAVRLQCAVRDWIEFPVSLIQALWIARDVLAAAGPHLSPEAYRKMMQADAEEREVTRIAEQRRIAAAAGKR